MKLRVNYQSCAQELTSLLLALLLCSQPLLGQNPAPNPGPAPAQNPPQPRQLEDLSAIPGKTSTDLKPGDTDGIRRQMYRILKNSRWNLFQFPAIDEAVGTVTYGTANGGELVGHVVDGNLVIDKTPGTITVPAAQPATPKQAPQNPPIGQTAPQPSSLAAPPQQSMAQLTSQQLAQISDLAQRRAIQQYLESLTVNIHGTFINDPQQPIGTAGWRDPNGNLVSLPQVEALILVQKAAMQVLTNARLYATQVQSMTPQQKENLVNQLRPLAQTVSDKYKAYMALEAKIKDVHGSVSGLRNTYLGILSKIAALEEQVKTGVAVKVTERPFLAPVVEPLPQAQQAKALQDAKAEIARLKDQLSGGLYQQYLDAQAQYYKALSANSLLGTQLPDNSSFFTAMAQSAFRQNPYFYQLLLQGKSNAELAKLLDSFAAQQATQYTQQIDRLSKMDNVVALWPLGGASEYALARQLAAASGGQATQNLVDMLEASYAGAKGVGDFQKGVEDTAIAMGQAIPGAGLAFTVISIFRDGNDYVVAYTDEKNAQAMAGAMGYQGVLDAAQRREEAGGKVALNVMMGAAEIPGLVNALKTGKNVKLVYNFGGKPPLRGGKIVATQAEIAATGGAQVAGRSAQGGGDLPILPATPGTAKGGAAADAKAAAVVGEVPGRASVSAGAGADVSKSVYDTPGWAPGRQPLSEVQAEQMLRDFIAHQDRVGGVQEVNAEIELARRAGVSEDSVKQITATFKPENSPLRNQLIATELMEARLQKLGFDLTMTQEEYNALQGISVRSNPKGSGLTQADFDFLKQKLAADPKYLEKLPQRGYMTDFNVDHWSIHKQPQEGFIAALNSGDAAAIQKVYQRWNAALEASPMLRGFEDAVRNNVPVAQLTDQAMALKANPQLMRSLKNAPNEVREAFNAAEKLVYDQHDAAVLNYVKGIQKDVHGNPTPWSQPGVQIKVDDFRTPGGAGTGVNTDRDYRILYNDPQKGWIEVPKEYWQNVSTNEFAKASGYTPEKLMQIASPQDVAAWQAWNPAMHEGETVQQAMMEKWKELHQQLGTDKFHPEASVEFSDQGILNGERAQIANNIKAVKTGDALLKDTEGFGIMYNEKADAYLRLKSNLHPEGDKLEAMAQLNKGIDMLNDVRAGYAKFFGKNGLQSPLSALPENFQEAAKAIQSLGPFDAAITADQIAKVEQTLRDLGFAGPLKQGDPFRGFVKSLDGQFEALKTIQTPSSISAAATDAGAATGGIAQSSGVSGPATSTTIPNSLGGANSSFVGDLTKIPTDIAPADIQAIDLKMYDVVTGADLNPRQWKTTFDPNKGTVTYTAKDGSGTTLVGQVINGTLVVTKTIIPAANGSGGSTAGNASSATGQTPTNPAGTNQSGTNPSVTNTPAGGDNTGSNSAGVGNQGGSNQSGTNLGGTNQVGRNQGAGQNSAQGGSNNNAGVTPVPNTPVQNPPVGGNNSGNNSAGANAGGANNPAGGNNSGNSNPGNNSGNNKNNNGNPGPVVTPPITPVGGTEKTTQPTSNLPSDYNNAQPYIDGNGHRVENKFRVTICKGSSYVLPIHGGPVSIRNIRNKPFFDGERPSAFGGEQGNGLNINGANVGTTTVEADVIPLEGSDPVHISVWVDVIDCNLPRKTVQPNTNTAIGNPVTPPKKTDVGGGNSNSGVTPNTPVTPGSNQPVGGNNSGNNAAGGNNAVGGNNPGASVVPGGQPGGAAVGPSQNPCPPVCDEKQLYQDFLAAQDKVTAAQDAYDTTNTARDTDQLAMSAAGNALSTETPGTPGYFIAKANLDAATAKYQGDLAALPGLQAAIETAKAGAAKAEKAYDDCVKKNKEAKCPPPQNTSNQGGSSVIGGNANQPAGGNNPGNNVIGGNNVAGTNTPGNNAIGGNTAGANPAGNNTIGGSSSPPGPVAPHDVPPMQLPPCLNPGEDCSKYLAMAQHVQAALADATQALATAPSDLAEANRLDQLAKPITANADKYSQESKFYAGQAQAAAAKAAAADTPESAAAWNKISQDDTTQANAYSDQAVATYTQANTFTAQANALRKKVDDEQKAVNVLTLDAAAAWDTYNRCLKLPPCPPKENPMSVMPSPTGNPTGGNGNGLGSIGGGLAGALTNLPGFLGLAALNAANSSLFGKAPVASPVQNIVVTVTITFGAALAPAPTTNAGLFPASPHHRSLSSNRSPANTRPSVRLAAFHSRGSSKVSSSSSAKNGSGSSSSVTPSSSSEGLTFSIASSGSLGHDALEFRVHDPSGKVKNIALPEGAVLEPLQSSVRRPVESPGGSVVAQQLTAYCLEMAKLPPDPGQLYRIAPQAVQGKYSSVRSVLRAGSKLAAANQFHPDSDPKAYNDFIRQHALWAQMENWGEQKFTDVFVDRTKKNAEHMKMNWTKQMEDVLRNAAPGRWRDIAMVLDEARKMQGSPAVH